MAYILEQVMKLVLMTLIFGTIRHTIQLTFIC